MAGIIATPAEQSIIGCILLGDNEMEIFAAVDARDFLHEELHNLYFETQEIWLKHRSVDIGAIPKKYTDIAIACAEFCPSVSSWRTYVDTMRKDAAERRVDDLSSRLVYDGLGIEEKYDVAEKILSQRQGVRSVRRMTMAEARRAFFIEQEKTPDYLKTGIKRVDETACIERGDYVVIGARPSVGKTAFALQVARSMAKNGKRAIFYSYETTIEKLSGRTMAGHCEIKMDKIKRHQVRGPGVDGLGKDLDLLPLELVESAGRGVEWIKADVITSKPDVVFIDYIGMIPSKGATRFEEVTNTSLSIREMCQSTGVTAIVLAQINREGHDAPTKESLKESGQIEQDADVIMLLHNPADLTEREDMSTIDLIVAKNKEGRVGKISLMMDGTIQRFYDVEGV